MTKIHWLISILYYYFTLRSLWSAEKRGWRLRIGWNSRFFPNKSRTNAQRLHTILVNDTKWQTTNENSLFLRLEKECSVIRQTTMIHCFYRNSLYFSLPSETTKRKKYRANQFLWNGKSNNFVDAIQIFSSALSHFGSFLVRTFCCGCAKCLFVCVCTCVSLDGKWSRMRPFSLRKCYRICGCDAFPLFFSTENWTWVFGRRTTFVIGKVSKL